MSNELTLSDLAQRILHYVGNHPPKSGIRETEIDAELFWSIDRRMDSVKHTLSNYGVRLLGMGWGERFTLMTHH